MSGYITGMFAYKSTVKRLFLAYPAEVTILGHAEAMSIKYL
jgi:hypothetical protein